MIPATEFNPCSTFVHTLTESRLMPADGWERLRAYQQAFPQRGPKELAGFLVEQRLLTRFQADAVLEGKVSQLTLASYTLTDIIGKGSMGTVYRARSEKDDHAYAIKIVPRRNVISFKLVAEKVQVLKQVRHPRVSALVHIGGQGERIYLVWPFLEGGEKLDAVVKKQGALPARQAAQVALQIASGLEAYHQHGLFHGLLKPTDVLIGTDRRVRILDFGVGFLLTCERGKSLLDTMTNNKTLTRGLDCASPEAILNALDRTPAGDQYSLGCVLYFCLTGQFPFPDPNPVKKMMAHQFEEPTPVQELNPGVPDRLAAIVERLMQKVPADRYESTAEVVQALQTVTAQGRGFPGTTPRPLSAGSITSPALAPSQSTEPEPEVEAEADEETFEAGSNEPAPGWGLPWVIAASVAGGVVAWLATWLLTR